MGGGMESSPLDMEKLMEWELVAEASDKKPLSSAASTTSDSAANNALVLEYLANMEVDVLTNAGESTFSLDRDESLQTAPEALKPASSATSVMSEAASQSKFENRAEAKQEEQGLLQAGLAWAPLAAKNSSDSFSGVVSKDGLTGGLSEDGFTGEVSEVVTAGDASKDADLEEDYEATIVILRKVTELALLQSSLPKGGGGGQALATIELLMRLEEVAGGPWDGTPTVHETLQGSEKKDSATVIKSLEGFFAKVSEALQLTEVQVHLTLAEEKARERRKKRMQFLGTVGGMSALLFVGAGAAVLAAEASLASAYTAYNIFFNPAAISAASAAVEAASGVAGLCGLGAVVPGATAASLGFIDMWKAHSRPVKVGHVARLRMIDCMVGYLEEGVGKKGKVRWF